MTSKTEPTLPQAHKGGTRSVGAVFLGLMMGGLVGKLLGLAREAIFAALYGVGPAVVANRVSLTATLVPINLFTADALSGSLLPLHSRYRITDNTRAQTLYRSVQRTLVGASFGIASVVIVLRGAWVDVLAPGLEEDTRSLAAQFLAISAAAIPFYVQFALYIYLSLSYDDVRPANIRGIAQSIGLIAGTILAFATGHLTLIAWGFTCPYIILCCWGWLEVRRKGYLVRTTQPDREVRKEVFRAFWRRLRPLLFVPLLLQGSISTERVVSSLLGDSVVAAADYARFIVDSGQALIAAPLGLASLAAFSRMDGQSAVGALRRIIPVTLLAVAPISVILAVNARPIVQVVYGRGRFDDEAISDCSSILVGFAWGFWATVLGYVLAKILSARGKNRLVAVVVGVSSLLTMACHVLMFRILGPAVVGVAATVGALTTLLMSSISLGIFRYCTKFILLCLPGVGFMTAVGLFSRRPGLAGLLVSSAAMAGAWLVFVILVPHFRDYLKAAKATHLRREQSSID